MRCLFLTPGYVILKSMSENIQILKEIENAVLLCQKDYTREDIFRVLKLNSASNPEIDIEKQICILKLDTVVNQEEADLLAYHQTGQHGLIREACSQKINEFMKNSSSVKFFQTKEISLILLKAVNDINPNICRTIIEVLPFIEDKNYFLDNLYKRFDDVFEELEKLKRSNWYTKKLFNLYWCLEALAVLRAPVDKRLESVLERCSRFRDYTIREKTAMVLSLLNQSSSVIESIKELLKNDENFYVQRYSSQW